MSLTFAELQKLGQIQTTSNTSNIANTGKTTGLTWDEIQRQANPSITPQQEQPGVFQSIVRSITSTPLRLASTVNQGIQQTYGIAQELMGNKIGSAKTQAEIERIKQQGEDMGYFGNVKPLNTTPNGQVLSGKDVVGSIGAGLELGSYAVPGAIGGKLISGVVKGQIARTAVTAALGGATQGALMGAGTAMQEQNPTIGNIAGGTAGGALVGGVMGGVLGTAIPAISKIAQSAPVKIALNKILPATEGRVTAIEREVAKARQSIASEYKKSLPLTPTQQTKEANLLNKTGDNIYTTLAKNDINIGSSQAPQQLADLNEVYSSATKAAQAEETAMFNITEARNNAINNLSDRLNSEVAITKARNQIDEEINAVLSKNANKIVRDVDGNLKVPSPVMEQLRKIGNDLTPFNSADPMKIGASAGYSLADAIRQQVAKEGSFPAYKDAMREWGKILHAQEVLNKLEASGKTFKLPGVFGGLSGSVTRKLLSGALGFHTGGVGGAVLSELGSETAAKILANPSSRTYFDRLLVSQLGKKQTPKIVQKLAQQIRDSIQTKSERLALKEGAIITPPPKDVSGIKLVPAEKTSPTVNPKTGKMQKTYLSTPKSADTTIATKTPPSNAIIMEKSVPQSNNNVKKIVPNQAFGGIAGIEIKKDENGNLKVSFNPEKAAIGIIGMTSYNKLSNSIKKDLGIKLTDELHSLVSKEISSLDTNLIKSNKGLAGDTESLFRLDQLKTKLQDKGISKAEVIEAIPLLKKQGIDIMKEAVETVTNPLLQEANKKK